MNKKPQILGKNIYVNLPSKEESKIIVDENTKEELNRKLLKKMQKLQVWGVGDAVNSKIKEGDWVLINPEAIQRAKIVPFEENGEEVMRALILDYDVIHIW